MTIQRMLELLEIEHECMLRGAHDDCDRNCADCELVQDDSELHEMYTDVISLLKEQEPKILDWNEIRNYPVVYGEFRGVKDIYPMIITVDSWGRCLSWNPGINVSEEFILLVSDEEDRKNTRCWDKMPTEEQRKAMKWE